MQEPAQPTAPRFCWSFKKNRILQAGAGDRDAAIGVGRDDRAMMQRTGWQQHSVRGFLAEVVRKRLKLNLDSMKVDSDRVYRMDHGRRAEATG